MPSKNPSLLPRGGGGHKISDAHIRSRGTGGLESGGVANSGGQGLTELKLNNRDGRDSEPGQRGANFQQAAGGVACFHDQIITAPSAKVLIERIYGFIDPGDDGNQERQIVRLTLLKGLINRHYPVWVGRPWRRCCSRQARRTLLRPECRG